jgi:DnaJ-class molecular chaperone
MNTFELKVKYGDNSEKIFENVVDIKVAEFNSEYECWIVELLNGENIVICPDFDNSNGCMIKIICPHCNGTGKTDKQVDVDYFLRGYYECYNCNGKGNVDFDFDNIGDYRENKKNIFN